MTGCSGGGRLVVPFVIIICLLAAAGCTTIPGPEAKPTATPVKTPGGPVTMQPKVTAVKTTIVPATVAQAAIPAAAQLGGSPLQTCTEQKGFLVQPGQTCPGAWMVASDTFSCCSQQPVRNAARNASVTISPLTLAISFDDALSPVLP